MTLFGFLVLLVIAAIAGSLGSAIAGYSSRGCLTSIILGFIGAMIGSWLSRELGVADLIYFHRIPIIWSVIGSALFVAIINMITGNAWRKSR